MSDSGPSNAPPSDDLIDVVHRAVARLEQHADPDVRRELQTLLAGIDAIHRTALTRLMAVIQTMGGDAFVQRLVGDPAVRMLLMSYDLIAVDRRLRTEEALDAVRGHLHAHGVDVELLDVVGGVVYVQLHGLRETGLQADAVRRDLEAALRDGLPGFQQLEIGARRPDARGGSAFVPVAAVRGLRAPVYRSAGRAADVESGALRAVEVDGEPILLARVEGDLHAVRNRCGDSPLPLEYSTLDGAILTCSWHGCRYDVRTGGRLDGPEGARLRVFPLRVEDGEIQVAVHAEPEARRAR